MYSIYAEKVALVICCYFAGAYEIYPSHSLLNKASHKQVRQKRSLIKFNLWPSRRKKKLKYEGINNGVHPTEAQMTFRFEWNLE